MATLKNTMVKFGDNEVNAQTAQVIACALLSSNPASQPAEFISTPRLLSAQALAKNLQAIEDKYAGKTLTVEVTLDDEKRGEVIKTRTVEVSNLRKVINAVVAACEANNVMDTLTSFSQVVENPTEGKRGAPRKSVSFDLEF